MSSLVTSHEPDVRLWPLHPAPLHTTIAFLLTGPAAETRAVLRRAPQIGRFGSLASAVGAASLVPAIITGKLAANTAPFDEAARAGLDRHEQVGWLLLALVLAGLMWKGWHRGELPPGQARLYTLLLLAVIGCVVWSAWLGGQMVYSYGVGVVTGGGGG